MNDHQREALSEIANAIQAAIPLVDRVRVTAYQQTRDCTDIRIALERVVEALRTMQPQQQKGGDR